MRRFLALAIFPAAMAACGGPSDRAGQEADFKNQLALHFNRLNQESAIAEIETKASLRKDAHVATSIGRTYSTYQWNPDGFILRNVEVKAAKRTVPMLVYTGSEVQLPAPAPENAGRADAVTGLAADLTEADLKKYAKEPQPMFQVISGNEKPMVALVRYVRRQNVYDAMGKVQISAKGYEKAGTTAETLAGDLETNPNKRYGGGYHRPDAAWVVTTAFVYRGGSITQVDPQSVAKLAKGETVPASQMTLGTTVGLEDYVQTWAEAPAKAPTGGTH